MGLVLAPQWQAGPGAREGEARRGQRAEMIQAWVKALLLSPSQLRRGNWSWQRSMRS